LVLANPKRFANLVFALFAVLVLAYPSSFSVR